MKLDVSGILKKDSAVMEFDLVIPAKDICEETDGIKFTEDVALKGNVTNNLGILNIEASLKSCYRTQCARCLAEISKEVDLTLKESFVKNEIPTDGLTYVYEGYKIDISQLVRDYMFLDIPIRQVCSDNCKGFCLNCGIHLSEKECQCNREESESRFEKLKNFF